MDDLLARAVTYVYYDDHAQCHQWLQAVCAAYGGEPPQDLAEFTVRLKAATETVNDQTVDGFMALISADATRVLGEIWQERDGLPGLFARAYAQVTSGAAQQQGQHPALQEGQTHWDESTQQWWVVHHGQWVVKDQPAQAHAQPADGQVPAADAHPQAADAGEIAKRVAQVTADSVAELRRQLPDAADLTDEQLMALAGRLVATQLGV